MDRLLLTSESLHSSEPSVTLYIRRGVTSRNLHQHLNLQCFMSYGKFMRSVVGVTVPKERGPSHCRRFTITLRHTIVGRTPLADWSTRRILYLTTYDTHRRQACMSLRGSNSHSQQARPAYSCLRPRGHRDRPFFDLGFVII